MQLMPSCHIAPPDGWACASLRVLPDNIGFKKFLFQVTRNDGRYETQGLPLAAISVLAAAEKDGEPVSVLKIAQDILTERVRYLYAERLDELRGNGSAAEQPTIDLGNYGLNFDDHRELGIQIRTWREFLAVKQREAVRHCKINKGNAYRLREDITISRSIQSPSMPMELR